MTEHDNLMKILNKDSYIRLILNEVPDAVICVNNKGIIVFANRQTETLFELAESALLGKPVEILMPEEFRDKHKTHVQAFFKDPKKRPMGLNLKLLACKNNGDTFPVDISLNPIEIEGELITLASVRDVTERKKIEAEIERINHEILHIENENWRMLEAAKIKSKLLHHVSHETRTPLNHIVGYAEILHDELEDQLSEEHKGFLEKVTSSSHKLSKLLEGLIALAYSTTGKLEFQLEEAHLPALVTELVKRVSGMANKKHLTLNLDVDANLPKAEIDLFRFKQVLYNLLFNAIAYTPDNGKITVRLKKLTDNEFRLEVEDTGPGIAEADIPNLFTSSDFFETDEKEETVLNFKGLSVAKRIIDACGGKIGVDSTPGKGSIFYVIMPFKAPEKLPKVKKPS